MPHLPSFLRCLALLAALTVSALAAEPIKQQFDLPADTAERALKKLSAQSGVEVLFATEMTAGVRTQAVSGRHTALEAANLALAGTGLVAVRDEQTGALTINREPPTPTEKNDASRRADDATAKKSTSTLLEDGTVRMEAFEVTGSRLTTTEAEGIAPIFSFDRQFIESTGMGTTEEFLRLLPQNFTGTLTGRAGVPNDAIPGVRNPGQSGAGLFGMGSNNTLVLIDGQRMPLAANGNNAGQPSQGFYDLNTVPLGMIERIEVLTDGASAIYGSDATAGVINIILKKHYNETELRGRIAGTWHGGAFERGGTLTHGFAVGNFNAVVVLDYFSREALFADQRSFSKTADQRSRGGSDLRSFTIGNPVRVFALPGQTLNGLNGATNAIAPLGKAGPLTPADFLPTANQATTTPYDTSHLQALIHPTERVGASTNLTYRWRPTVTLSAQLSYTDDTTRVLNVPQPTSSANGNVATGRIPATNPYNPFGQNLGFIILHEEFGPRVTESDTQSFRAAFGASIVLPRDWQAQMTSQFSTQRLRIANPVLNVAAMNAALNQTDPTKALNLFGDPRLGPTNAPGVYESIFLPSIEQSKSDLYTAQAFARGPLYTLPGGPLQMAAGAEWQQQDRIRTSNTPSIVLPARTRFTRDTWAAFAEVSVPLFGEKFRRPLAHALDLQIAGRYEDIERAGTTLNPKYGVRWQPLKGMLMRGSYSTGFRAPSPSEFEQNENSGFQNINDPTIEIGLPFYQVQVLTGSNRELKPETSETWNFGVLLSVPGIKGLSVGADYSQKEQYDLTTSLTAQVIVNNEAIFPDRVIRGPDGRIVVVDASHINFGFLSTETIDFTLRYDVPWQTLGRFTVQASVSHFLNYTMQLTPNATTGADDLIGTSSNFPASTRGNWYVHWNKGDFGATLLGFYNAGYMTGVGLNRAKVSSSTTWDLNGTYIWRRFNLRLQAGIGNLFDQEPSFLNVPLGYPVGSQPGPKQRTYQFSATYTF